MLILSALPLEGLGAVEGQWTYIVENGGATITASTATGAVMIPSELGGYAVKKVGQQYTSIFGNSNTSVTSVTIPSSVTSIGAYAFNNSTSLASVTFQPASSVTTIESYAFMGCTSLTSIIIPQGVQSIANHAFPYCSSLTSINIPSSVTSIGMFAFFRCTSLASVNFEPTSSLQNIEFKTFFGCTSLTSISIPSNVTSIGDSSFGSCNSLASITFERSSSLTIIASNAFQNCTGLTSITIPSSVTSIGGEVFTGCTSLVSVFLPERFATTYQLFGLTESQANFGIRLTSSCNASEGTILVNPNKRPYEIGETVVISATPNAGYLFSNWSGDSTGTMSSITLTMDSSKSVTAIFVQDGRDNDGDGLTNYQESITYETNPNQKDSNLDGVEDGVVVSLGYSPTFNFSALTTHWQNNPPPGLYTASQMQAMAFGDLVLTKNVNGSFTLNYDIEQSTDLQSWTRYQELTLPLNGLPSDKAFVRIKAKQ